MTEPTVHIIAGPTASGKSARALELARVHNGAVINADSLQIYQDSPILSAIPDAQEMGDTPHKLYGFLKPDVLSINNYLVLLLVFGPALVVTIILVFSKILKAESN